jgi:hypothetical protein
MKDYILCAATHFDDGKLHVHQPKNIETGIVICGRRHHNVYATLAALKVNRLKLSKIKTTQGFLTAQDKFVDRKEAAMIAFRACQIQRRQKSLGSEDLW